MFPFRFDGVAPEPRKGIRAGHVPGSRCIPFGQVVITDVKSMEESHRTQSESANRSIYTIDLV